MYPTPVTLKDELGEAYLPLLLHLLDEFEQPAMVGLVARDEVSCTAQYVVTVLRSTHQRIEFLATVSTGHHYRLTPRLAYGIEQLVYEYVQEMISTLRGRILDALPLRRSAACQFFHTKIFHEGIYYLTIYKLLFIYNWAI